MYLIVKKNGYCLKIEIDRIRFLVGEIRDKEQLTLKVTEDGVSLQHSQFTLFDTFWTSCDGPCIDLNIF